MAVLGPKSIVPQTSKVIESTQESIPAKSLLGEAAKNKSPSITNSLWVQSEIDPTRWDKSYPFQLLVVQSEKQSNGEVTFKKNSDWIFTLPIGPQSLTITQPFANRIEAALGGFREISSGSPFRLINIRGTMGLLPGRSNGVTAEKIQSSAIETIAGGTVARLQNIQDRFNQTIATVAGSPLTNPNLHSDSEFEVTENDSSPEAILAKTTGYFQMQQLIKFLERYAEIKKTREARNLSLAFANWKDQSVYLCTPITFETDQNVSSPLEKTYNLVLKAWSRIALEAGEFVNLQPTPARRDPNVLARIINSLNSARRTMQSISKLPAAVIGDVNKVVFEPLREAVLFCKDTIGAGLSLADLPDQLANDWKKEYSKLGDQALLTGKAATNLSEKVKKQLGLGKDLNRETKSMVNKRSTKIREKLIRIHPATKPFENPKSNFDFMNEIEVSSLKVPANVQRKVNSEIKRVKNLSRLDFEVKKNSILNAASRLAISLGAGDTAFEETFNIQNITKVKEVPTDSDWEVLYALNESVASLEYLSATGDGQPSEFEKGLDLMAGLARRSGIAFQTPKSKFAVPFPFGFTLERLAENYLGDASRWHEIASLNGLKEPYVDEEGFELSLLVNGADNQIIVDFDDRLYINQAIWLESTGVHRIKRRITGLNRIVDQLIVSVSGESNLDVFKVTDSSKLVAFEPDTVNSQQLIYIPSQKEPADDNFITKSIPGVNEFDPLVAVGGVDLLLDSNNDLIITPDGDTKLAIGLANIIQNLRIAMSTVQGTLLGHPSFGIPIQVGMSTADFNAKRVLEAIRRMVSQDSGISRIDSINVSQSGPIARIAVNFVIQGTDKPVPVSFDVLLN